MAPRPIKIIRPTRPAPKPANHTLTVVLLLAIAGVAAAGYWFFLRPAPVVATNVRGPARSGPGDGAPEETPEPAVPAEATPTAPVPTAQPELPTLASLQEELNNPQVVEQMGRVALSTVGATTAAEKVWLFAINSPALAANVRKNLIEDLNEAGLSNPQNPTVADLPLIESRIALIDRIAPDALDATNAAAFQEARKDLVALRDKLQPK